MNQAIKQPESIYTVSEVANIMRVTRQTVYKWIEIAPDDSWFKTPGGKIRIRESLVERLKSGKI